MLYRNLQKLNTIDIPAVSFRFPVKYQQDKCKDIADAAQTAFTQGITLFDLPPFQFNQNTSTQTPKDKQSTLDKECSVYMPDSLAAAISIINNLKNTENTAHNLLLSATLILPPLQTGASNSQCLFNQLSMLLSSLEKSCIDFVRIAVPESMDSDSFIETESAAFLINAKKDGLIKAAGFEANFSIEDFKKTASLNAWDFCAFKFNYLDIFANTANSFSHSGTNKNGDPVEISSIPPQVQTEALNKIAIAESQMIGVFALDPFAGGKLASPARSILNIFAHTEVPRIPAEWALRWILENQNVISAVATMNSPIEAMVNCAIASAAFPNSLPQKQLDVIKKAAAAFLALNDNQL